MKTARLFRVQPGPREQERETILALIVLMSRKLREEGVQDGVATLIALERGIQTGAHYEAAKKRGGGK